MSSQSSTKELSSLIHHKHDLLQRIGKMVDRQCQTIDERGVVELMPILTAKQKLLDELHRVEAKLNPFRAQDPETRNWESEDERAECAGLVETNRTMLREILDKEQQCERRLQEQREQTRQAMERQDSAGDAIQAYGQDQEPIRNRLDLSSE